MSEKSRLPDVNDLLSQLENVRKTGESKWSARCPSHDDRRNSLSVSAGNDGTILLKCHAGCETGAIVAAVGLSLKDLFPSAEGRERNNGSGRAAIVATYDYRDESGELLFQVCRSADKDFPQRKPDGKGGWSWSVKGVRKVLYRLPELLAADPSQPVFIVEGEKDVDRLWSLGLVATCNPGGAGKWRAEYNTALKGRHAVTTGDNDAAGRKHAQTVARSLHRSAASVKVIELPGLPDKGDVSDWLADDGKASDLFTLASETPEWEPADDPRSLAIVRNLADVQPQPVRWLWPDRIPLGKLTLLAGDPGLGKSFMTLDMAARVSSGRGWPDRFTEGQPAGSVILFSAEDDLADTIRPRLDKAGADVSRIVAVQGVQWFDAEADRKSTRFFSLERDLPELEQVIARTKDVRLVVIDPISAYCGKIDSHKNTDVRGLLAPLAELAGKYGVAIVAVTHLSKGAGGKAVYRAMGSLAYIAAARAGWLVVKDRKNPSRRLMLPLKMNIAEEPTGLAFAIIDGVVAWEADPVDLSSDDALAAEVDAHRDDGRQSEREEAKEWLLDTLARCSVLATEIRRWARQDGITPSTLRRAKEAVGVVSKRVGFGADSRVYWTLDSA